MGLPEISTATTNGKQRSTWNEGKACEANAFCYLGVPLRSATE